MLEDYRKTEKKICMALARLLAKKLHADGFTGLVLSYHGSGDEAQTGAAVALDTTEMPLLTEETVFGDLDLPGYNPVKTALLDCATFAAANGYADWLVKTATTADLRSILGQRSGRFNTIRDLLDALLFVYVPNGYENNDGGAGILFFDTSCGDVYAHFGGYYTAFVPSTPVRFTTEGDEELVDDATNLKGDSNG